MNRGYFGSKSRLTRLFAGSLVSALIFAWSFSSFYTKNFSTKTVERQYLVMLRDLPQFSGNSVGISHFDEIVAKNNAKVEDLYATNDGELGQWIVVTGDENLAADLCNDIGDVAEIETDQTVTLVDPTGEQNNQLAEKDKLWGLRVSKTKEGLNVLKPTRQVLVGVVDTGCDLNHPALKDNLVKGHNFAGGNVEDPSNRNADELHATHVTGTIVAKADADGFYGIANSVAKVMPVRVLNESGSGTLIAVARGIEYAANNGVDVINMSLGAPSYSRALHDSVKFAVNTKGVTVVCAKGNSNTDRAFYPAEFPEVIRVTATNLRADGIEERAFFSNYGKSSTCAAPGHYTYSTLPGGKYGFLSGTSMACPHAAACAAVVLSQNKLTPEEVKAIIETRGDELKTDKPIGKRINLLKFVEKAAHDSMPLINDHPYGQCCIDAGIISRDTTTYDGNMVSTMHEDSDGTATYHSTLYGTDGTTTFHSEGGEWLMVYTPKTSDVTEDSGPVSVTASVTDWCWKCADFHRSNKVCSGVREQPSMPYASKTEIHVADWCTTCNSCHTPKCPHDTTNPALYLIH